MRKLILGIGLGLAVSFNAFALSFSVTVLPGTMTNILSFSPNQGAVLVKQVTLTSLGTSASSFSLIDAPTNSLVFVNPAYSNRVSYATNFSNLPGSVYTNFYGVVQTNTWIAGVGAATNIWALVDITNNIVPATTNYYPTRMSGASAANATVIFGPNVGGQLNGYYFDQGIWATNTSASGTNVITIVF